MLLSCAYRSEKAAQIKLFLRCVHRPNVCLRHVYAAGTKSVVQSDQWLNSTVPMFIQLFFSPNGKLAVMIFSRNKYENMTFTGV